MGDVQVGVQVNVAGADQIKELGSNLNEAGDNAKTAGSSFATFGQSIAGLISSIGLLSNGLFSMSDAFDSVERADIRVARSNKTVRELLEKRQAILADLNQTQQQGITIERTANGQLVTTIGGHVKLVAVMRDGALAIQDSKGRWQRLVQVYKDARGNLVATDGVFHSLVNTLKDGSQVYTDAFGHVQKLDQEQVKHKFTVQDLSDNTQDLNTAYERQNLAVKQDEKAHAQLIPRLISGATQMVGGSLAALEFGKQLLNMGGRAKSAGSDIETGNKSMGSMLGSIGKIAIPLAAAAAAYLILKNNIGGSREALEKLGAQVGTAVPALQPLLKVIGDIGRGILGLGFGNLNQDLKQLQNQLAPIFNTLKTKFDEMSNSFQTFVQQIIRGDLSGALNTLIQSATKLGTDISNAIKSVDWSKVWQGLQNAWTSTVSWFANAGTNLVTSITKSVQATNWSAVGKAIADDIGKSIEFSDEIIRIALSRFTAAWKTAAENYDWKTTTNVIVDHMKTSLDSNIQGFTNLGKSILDGIKGAMTGKTATATDWGPVGNAIISGISDGTKKGDWSVVGKNILGAMQATFKTNVEGYSAIGQAILDGIIAAIVGLGNAAAAFGQAISDKITAGVQQLKVDFSKVGQIILDGIITAIVGLGNAAAAFAQAIGDKIRSGLDQIKLDLGKNAENIIDTFVTAIVNLPNAVKAFAQAVSDKIKSGVQQAITDLTSSDFATAASDLWNKVSKAISDFFSGQKASAAGGGQGIPSGLNVIKVPINVDTTEAVKNIGVLTSRFKEVPADKSTQFHAETVTAKANVDQLLQTMGGAQNVLDTITKQTYTVKVTANTATLLSDLGGIQTLVTTITQQQYNLTVNANTSVAQQALGGLQTLVTTITQQQYNLTVNANTVAAQQALGGLQTLVTTITQQQYNLTVIANTVAAQQAIGGLQTLVVTVTQQRYTITVGANTVAAQQAIGGLQTLVTTVVRQNYTLTVNVDTRAAEQKIANLRNQLASLMSIGGTPGAAPLQSRFAASGGTFGFGINGFEQLYAARGGSFVVNRRTNLANLTVGEGNKPELVTYNPKGLVTVIPIPKLFAATGGQFPVFGSSPGAGLFPGMGFNPSASYNPNPTIIEYGGIPAPKQSGSGGPTGQYGAPNLGGGAGGLVPGGPGYGFTSPGGAAAAPGQGTMQIAPVGPVTPAPALAKVATQQQQASQDLSKITDLLEKLINMLARGQGFAARVSIDGQRIAQVADKYIGSRSYGDL